MILYSDGSLSDKKAAAAAVIDDFSIEHLRDKSKFSAEMHALYLALDRVESVDDAERNLIIFSRFKVCSSGHLGPRLDSSINNKLHQLGIWHAGFRVIRHDESVLARIWIGHSHLTHSFLL